MIGTMIPEHDTVFSVVGFERAKFLHVMDTADMMFLDTHL